jgi:hypothetical protein
MTNKLTKLDDKLLELLFEFRKSIETDVREQMLNKIDIRRMNVLSALKTGACAVRVRDLFEEKITKIKNRYKND